jgi:hypothetical protein
LLAFGLLLVAFRSVAIPLVSVALNLLSVAGAFGTDPVWPDQYRDPSHAWLMAACAT